MAVAEAAGRVHQADAGAFAETRPLLESCLKTQLRAGADARYCWGENYNGQFGSGTTGAGSATPLRIETPRGTLDGSLALITVPTTVLVGLAAALYAAAAENPPVHLLEHVTFFAAGLALWWPLIQPVPMRRRMTGMQPVAYVAPAKGGLAAAGLYPARAATPSRASSSVSRS